MEKFNKQKYDEKIDAYFDELSIKAIDMLKKDMAITFDDIVQNSPVWSGSYLASHRIRINSENTRGPVNLRIYADTGGLPIRISESQAAELRGKARVEKGVLARELKISDEITIINQSDHAVLVETTIEPVYQAALTRARNRLAAKSKSIVLTGRRTK